MQIDGVQLIGGTNLITNLQKIYMETITNHFPPERNEKDLNFQQQLQAAGIFDPEKVLTRERSRRLFNQGLGI